MNNEEVSYYLSILFIYIVITVLLPHKKSNFKIIETTYPTFLFVTYTVLFTLFVEAIMLSFCKFSTCIRNLSSSICMSVASA